MALIAVEGLCFRYPSSAGLVLDNLSTTVSEGERVAILAPNGGGKTTLARFLAGLLPEGVIRPERGRVCVDGRPWETWPAWERATAVQFVGQVPSQQLSGAAFTVADEIAFGPCNLGLPAADVRARVARALHVCNLERLAERDPFTLSGGEQQRLSIAAALAMQPRVLVLDEPTSNLDPESRDAFLEQLEALPKTLTVIVCEVALRPCLAFAERFMLLAGGAIVADGSAQHVLEQPLCTAMLGRTGVAEAASRVRAAGAWPADAALPQTLVQAAPAFAEAARALRR